MRIAKLSTARNVIVFMTTATDHVTGLAGLTLTITASKDGAAFAGISPSVTDRGSGWYSLALTTSHTDTLGDLALHITATLADPSDLVLQVCSELPGQLSASGIQSIWDALTSALTTSGSIGKLFVDNLNATVGSRSTLTAAGVWDALTSGITTSSTIGKLLVDNVNATISSRSTLTAAGVWDALTSGIVTANSIGKLIVDNVNATISSRSTLTAAGVWDALLSGITTTASIGKLIKDNLDVVLSTRLASGSYTAPDNATIATIVAKTNLLPASPADSSDVTDAVTALESDLSAMDTKLDTILTLTGFKRAVGVTGFQFAMYDATGDLATGLSPVTVQVSLDGAGFNTVSDTPVEISSGWYKVDLSGAEMTAKMVAFRASASGAKDTTFVLNTEG